MKKYPIVVKKMSDKETKEYFLKRIEALCLKSLNKDTFYSRPGYYFTPNWDEEELTRREKTWL
jgi:hypothetical protein